MVSMVGGTAREMVGGQQTSFGLGLHDESSRCPILQSTGFFDGLHHSYALVVWECCGVCPEMWEYGLCCMVQGWHDQPCVLEMAAHIVMFPPRWPGTSIMALWPMTFLPLLLVFARLNPASSIKMNSCGIAWASISSTPWKQRTKAVNMVLSSTLGNNVACSVLQSILYLHPHMLVWPLCFFESFSQTAP